MRNAAVFRFKCNSNCVVFELLVTGLMPSTSSIAGDRKRTMWTKVLIILSSLACETSSVRCWATWSYGVSVNPEEADVEYLPSWLMQSAGAAKNRPRIRFNSLALGL